MSTTPHSSSHLLPKPETRHDSVLQSLRCGHNIVGVSMPSCHIVDNVVVYEIDVYNRKLRWNLWRKFQHFYNLHQILETLATELSAAQNTPIVLPPFPEKRVKLFTDHLDEHFIENRRILLENYLQKILQHRYLRHQEQFVQFLVPDIDEQLDTKSVPEQKQEHSQKPSQTTQIVDDEDHGGDEDLTNAVDEDIDSKLEEHSTTKKTSENGKPSEIEAMTNHFLSIKNVKFLGLDKDDEITACRIPSAQILKHDHAIFQIHVENENIDDEDHCRWTVMKRFCDFSDFENELRLSIMNDYPHEVSLLPPLPPKYFKMVTDHLDETFIEKRRLLLQGFLQSICKHRLLRRHQVTLKFLQVWMDE